MKLYGSYTSPYVRHCRIALIDEGIEFEFVETDQVSSAEISPTKRVPFLQDGQTRLSDSSSILKYVREQAGKRYLAEIEDFDRFCFANTLMDSAANVFYLEKFGLKADDNAYVQRQNARIEQGLAMMNEWPLLTTDHFSDSQLRIACFIDHPAAAEYFLQLLF